MEIILRGRSVELIPGSESEKEEMYVREILNKVIICYPLTKITTWVNGVRIEGKAV